MPRIIVTAQVNDVEEWLRYKADMVPALSAVASDGSSYVASDGSNRVASTWDVPDMDAFMAAQRSFSPDQAAAAERAGMIPSRWSTSRSSRPDSGVHRVRVGGREPAKVERC